MSRNKSCLIKITGDDDDDVHLVVVAVARDYDFDCICLDKGSIVQFLL